MSTCDHTVRSKCTQFATSDRKKKKNIKSSTSQNNDLPQIVYSVWFQSKKFRFSFWRQLPGIL